MALIPAALGVVAEWSLNAIPWVVFAGTIFLLAGVRRLDRLT
jgi:hypothetical protein